MAGRAPARPAAVLAADNSEHLVALSLHEVANERFDGSPESCHSEGLMREGGGVPGAGVPSSQTVEAGFGVNPPPGNTGCSSPAE
jgi:hypothetical protein